jgi:serine/threonine-protein kinase RsbT
MTGNGSNQKRVDLLIRDTIEVIQARREGLEMAKEMGFSLPEATKIAVVISELARNILNYAGHGTITLIVHTGEEQRFEIIARDRGPGIADVARVLAGGYSTSGGLGKGLSGSKRLMDTFHVDSRVGFGTTIKASKRLR